MGEKRDIHDLIGEWHNAPEDGRPLHEFLGLTWEQYAVWATGGGLPEGCVVRDGGSEAGVVSQRYRGRPHRKKARRLAQAELAKLYRGEYMRLLVKYEKLLTEGGAEGGQQDV